MERLPKRSVKHEKLSEKTDGLGDGQRGGAGAASGRGAGADYGHLAGALGDVSRSAGPGGRAGDTGARKCPVRGRGADRGGGWLRSRCWKTR